MSWSAKLEADSARLRVLEDAINAKLAHVRGKLEGLRAAEAALLGASGILTEGGDAKQAPGESLSSPVASASPTTDAQQPDPQDTSHKRMGE